MGSGRDYRGSFLLESPYIPEQCMHSFVSSKPKKTRICAGCNTQVDGGCLSRMGGHWHPDCFRCRACDEPIPGNNFLRWTTSRTMNLANCIIPNVMFARIMYVGQSHYSNMLIRARADGLVEFGRIKFWRQKYCLSHEDDGTPRCCSCLRFYTVDATDRYLHLEDGRKLCPECSDSSIMNTLECQTLYLELQDFFEGLNMKLDQQIPLLLVETQALKDPSEKEEKGVIRARCFFEEQESKRSNTGSYRMLDFFSYRKRWEVKEIRVIYGLPRVLTGTILAHEMMHAWLLLNGYPEEMDPKVEEGMCQVVAHMWLESEIGGGCGSNVSSNSTHQQRWKRISNNGLKKNSCPKSGDGFREAYEAVVNYGLKRTLDYIRLTRRFPPSSTFGLWILDAFFPH